MMSLTCKHTQGSLCWPYSPSPFSPCLHTHTHTHIHTHIRIEYLSHLGLALRCT
ncbi:hypothetical protein CGRA01v4_13640 [Colletotrichum graminicola]|nr:hypothetical protein CGRA01v4_13640 [Colletotrichum graminicola]